MAICRFKRRDLKLEYANIMNKEYENQLGRVLAYENSRGWSGRTSARLLWSHENMEEFQASNFKQNTSRI